MSELQAKRDQLLALHYQHRARPDYVEEYVRLKHERIALPIRDPKVANGFRAMLDDASSKLRDFKTNKR